ncbi:putative copper metallochaperone, required for cytochrome c oxidase assembly [Scheffersomyces coipomensis]|uniref:putative copper metallochaperone, required for cytochrome c oxidase assembly n=1 Tax=Scheffersomyces coipomensis TaxID=1788519 RepID=UPI00315DE456
MASGAPGGNFRHWSPTPPERGSFPLDHYGECTEYMNSYLKCMKFTQNQNAPNCRILAKQYLKCRMDNQLMEQSEWDSLGLVNLPGDAAAAAAAATKSNSTTKIDSKLDPATKEKK